MIDYPHKIEADLAMEKGEMDKAWNFIQKLWTWILKIQ